MAKIHDIVETSKMSMEYDGSLIDVTHRAKKDLDNGRLVVLGADGTYDYAGVGEKGEIKLIASVEQMADLTKGLTEFYNLEGNLVRTLTFRNGDMYKTSAFTGEGLAKGDELIPDANGILKKGTVTKEGETVAVSPKIRFFVEDAEANLGFVSYSYGFDYIPAIMVRIERA